ncbi:MAG: hypothetical protein OEW35_05275 [Gammaproteobacteria bacterium]|nr:hypothetical protein [Gammaproteobacteria bacterium]MDH4253113.1 hypothetical protein [Gammaproteobacteria bacterium]MDH5308940.1 hypothetical protein [Gammaproteobacteria bacterium]
MLLRRVMEHCREQNWFAVLLDFLVVVVGLFVGLQIDTWWEGRRDIRLEQVYLAELAEDFAINGTRLQGRIAESEAILRAMVALQEQAVHAMPDAGGDVLGAYVRELQNMPTFIAVDRAYNNLAGSGDLKLIRSRELRNALASYYSRSEVIELVQQTHEAELVHTFQPYIIAHLDYAAVAFGRLAEFPLPAAVEPGLLVDALPTREFRNIVTQKWIIMSDLLNQFRNQLERNNEIEALIEASRAT